MPGMDPPDPGGQRQQQHAQFPFLRRRREMPGHFTDKGHVGIGVCDPYLADCAGNLRWPALPAPGKKGFQYPILARHHGHMDKPC